MKLIIVIMLFCESLFAVPTFKAMGTGSNHVWLSLADCVKAEKDKPGYEGCFDRDGAKEQTHSVQDVNDLSKPIYRDIDQSPITVECDDPADCEQKAYIRDGDDAITGHVCQTDSGSDPKWIKSDSWASFFGLSKAWFVYCQKRTGYEQKKALVLDAAKKTAYDAAQAEKLAAAQLMKEGARARAFGKQMIDYLVGHIKTKGLPKTQRKQLRQDFKEIVETLEIGQLDVAKDLIAALPEDGVVVTAEVKAKVDAMFQAAGI